MASMTVLQEKDPGEGYYAVFDFTSIITAPGATISSASVTASVWAGVDPSPGSLIAGSASISGLVVTQLLANGVSGVIYKLRCSAVGSDGSTDIMTAYLPVVLDPL